MTIAFRLIWAYLLHLSYNMWADRETDWLEHVSYKPYLRFDQSLCDSLLQQMAAAGMNMVVLDLGDGVVYDSHPEIAVNGAWSTEKLRAELARMRQSGLEPIPKLNFSTCHDAWLGTYARMVSTDTYYAVCRDLIAEVCELFDHPRFFHLGMDEETAQHQEHYDYVTVRQHDLWWHDLYFLLEQVRQHGVRPWVWSDYYCHHPATFLRNMPVDVLQSNWYYGESFNTEVPEVQAYKALNEHGYDQVPTGSNWSCESNFDSTVELGKRTLDARNLLGYMQTVWKPTLGVCRDRHEAAILQVRDARLKYYGDEDIA